MTLHERDITAHAAIASDPEFARAVLEGLSAPYKHLPCQYFYDAAGSRLFEEITALEEYYPTRTETGILQTQAASMAGGAGAGVVLVEFGSGSSRKTELLLAALQSPRAYVPIDVSQSALDGARRRLAERLPGLAVVPVRGDFSGPVTLPESLRDHPRLGFFPGSTIGNFDPTAAVALLAHFRQVLGSGSRLLIGVDLEKNPLRLLAAYNDAKGVTAAFNRNLLVRINRELGGDFDVSTFAHLAIYDEERKRIEMHLVSRSDQRVHILGQPIAFAAGETIHTENSYKYGIGRFQEMAGRAGWTPVRVWTDAARDFSVHELRST